MQNHCFHCPETLQKGDKISSKKYSATRPPQNRQFSVQGDPGWHHEPKRVPKGTPKSSPQGGQLPMKINDFWGSPLLPLPKSPKASISEALLINFEPFLVLKNVPSSGKQNQTSIEVIFENWRAFRFVFHYIWFDFVCRVQPTREWKLRGV